MGFETVHTACAPMVPKSSMKLQACGLHLHASLQSVRSLCTPPYKAINFFSDVDKWLIHRRST
jgi:hypothetical protein